MRFLELVTAGEPVSWRDFIGTIVVLLAFLAVLTAYVLLRIFDPSTSASPIDELLLILGGAVPAVALPGLSTSRR